MRFTYPFPFHQPLEAFLAWLLFLLALEPSTLEKVWTTMLMLIAHAMQY